MDKKYNRRSIRLKEYDYSSPGWYYVTICTQNQECVLGNVVDGKMVLNQLGEIVQSEWLKTPAVRINLELDEFVVMPNHFHGILILNELSNEINVGATGPVAPTNQSTNQNHPTLTSNSLGSIIGQFKSVVTKKIHKNVYKHFKWQRNYYEHIIRNDQELYQIRKYIRENPLKWYLDKYWKG